MSIACVVLAGGLGTRLRSAVPDLPKCLAPVAGRPFLEWQLRSLSRRGIDRFVLALGHGADQVKMAVSEPWAKPFSLDFVVENEALGTGGATRYAMEAVDLQEALVVNGDTFLAGDLSSMLAPIDLDSGERMRIATVHVPDRARFGGISVGPDNCIDAFFEKGQTGAGVINAGLYRVHRTAFEGELNRSFSMETSVMPKLLAVGALQAREVTGPFIDIGVPEDYRTFCNDLTKYESIA